MIASELKQISRDEFFSSIGRLNVHPYVRDSTLKGRFHVSDWIMQDGTRRCVAVTESDAHLGEPTKFYVPIKPHAGTDAV